MASSRQETISRLLARVRDGDDDALNDLFPLVYDELHALARRKRRAWQGNHTLNTTALVHEAYLKLAGQEAPAWSTRAHFLAVAAKAMRHILINYAERRQAKKRGGDVPKLPIDDDPDLVGVDHAWTDDQTETLIRLDQALRRLGGLHPRQSRIVECRFFGGMTIDETAAALQVSPATVKRGWAVAQAWLHREMHVDVNP